MTEHQNKQMNRRTFIKLSGLLTAGCGLSTNTVAKRLASRSVKRPNILFIIADDQDYEALGAVGGEVRTPNLDALFEKGAVFSHAYNPGSWSGAVCVPARTMLNTGRFLWRAHAVNNELDQEQAQGRFWSQYLNQAGYDTYFSGKWHVGTDVHRLFDTVRNVRPGMPRVFPNNKPHAYDRPREGQHDTWDPTDPAEGGFWQGGRHWSDVLADDGVDFIRQAAKQNNPFFMYLAFNAPHDPRQSPKTYLRKYPQEAIQVPINFKPEYPHNEAIGSGRGLRDERLAPFPRTDYAVRVHRSEYYAIITHMDTQIGRILDALKEQQLEDSTCIIFTADHGLAVGQHGLFGKQNMYDHSVRVPLVIAGPGIRPGLIESPVYLQDVMPTTLELAGVQKPDNVEFQSLLPLIQGRRERLYDAIYGAYLHLQRMITADGFKLILYPEISRVLLFDLKNDPYEQTNLAGTVTYQTRTKTLFRNLLKIQQQIGDPLDLTSTFSQLLE